MNTSELDYDLPPERIAQTPVDPRDAARLMVVNRTAQTLTHKHVYEMGDYLRAGDVLIANDTRVLNARLVGKKPSGGKAEILLLRKLNETDWEALVGGRRVTQINFELAETQMLFANVIEKRDGQPQSVVRFSQTIEPYLDQIGETPLPPYIHQKLHDHSRYQTVYANTAGSAAAPTAGLHFTPQLLDALRARGVQIGFVTLHVGLDTFKPIDESVVEAHKIHTEWCAIGDETAHLICNAKANGGRVFAVGTTSMRVLETWGQQRTEKEKGWSGFTNIFITPGYSFKVVDALMTNYHLPKSTLLALVGAFMGVGFMRRAYAEAIAQQYRFYSFGDAMLIV